MEQSNDDVTWMIACEIPRLRRYALSLVDEPHLADDLVQDCIERAIRKKHLWKRHGRIRNWLYRILYTVFLNQAGGRRRQRDQMPLDDVQASASVPANQIEQIACNDLFEEMRRLPPEQQAAISLTVIEGCSYDEAAHILDVPIGTLRSRLFRARERLREAQAESRTRPALRRVK